MSTETTFDDLTTFSDLEQRQIRAVSLIVWGFACSSGAAVLGAIVLAVTQ